MGRSEVIRLIGDLHGNLVPLRQAVAEGRTVVHLGDLGFAREWRKAALLPNVHVVGGNHDDYEVAPTCSCYLGDFGDLSERVTGAEGIFFVRGALSIDRHMRVEGRDWWAEEELSPELMDGALAAYAIERPHTMFTHEAPWSIVCALHNGRAMPSRTSYLLESMLRVHEPERWIFAHHHVRWQAQIGSTAFRCLGIDEMLDLDPV